MPWKPQCDLCLCLFYVPRGVDHILHRPPLRIGPVRRIHRKVAPDCTRIREGGAWGPAHNGGNNFSYVDGHAKWVPLGSFDTYRKWLLGLVHWTYDRSLL